MDVKEALKEAVRAERFGSRPKTRFGDPEPLRSVPTQARDTNIRDPSTSYIADEVLLLDSFLKIEGESNPSRGTLVWSLAASASTDSGDASSQYIPTLAQQDNVIEIEMMPFAVPYLPEVPHKISAGAGVVQSPVFPISSYDVLVGRNETGDVLLGTAPYPTLSSYPTAFVSKYPDLLGWPTNPYSQTPGNLLAVYVAETGKQSYSTFGGGRHNFEFSLQPADSSVGAGGTAAYPSTGDRVCSFLFTQPLSLPKITLNFFNPDFPVNFEDDVFYGVTITNSGPIGPGLIPFRIVKAGHGLIEGDRIYVRTIEKPNTASPHTNAVITQLNRPEGFTVTSAATQPVGSAQPLPNPMTLDAFMLNPLVLPDTTMTFTGNVYILKRRLRIPLRVRRLMPSPTQGVVPV